MKRDYKGPIKKKINLKKRDNFFKFCNILKGNQEKYIILFFQHKIIFYKLKFSNKNFQNSKIGTQGPFLTKKKGL